MINNEVSFEVVFKEYKKHPTRLRVASDELHNGKNAKKRMGEGKFSIEFRVIAPTDIFEISVSDWDLTRTLRKACEKMSTEIEHRFHVSDK